MIDALARVSQDPGSFVRLVSEMDGAGVRRAVLFPESPQVPARFLSELRSRFLPRFAVVSAIDPQAEDAALAVKETRVRYSIDGFEMTPQGDRRWINTPGVMPVWEELEALGVSVSLGISSQDYNELSDVVTGYPGVRIVLENLGSGPETTLSQYVPIVVEYARYPQVYVGISSLFRVSCLAYPHRDLWPIVEEMYRAYGAGRLVWGSGYPEVGEAGGYRKAAELLATLPFLSGADLQMIQEGNASRLWFE